MAARDERSEVRTVTWQLFTIRSPYQSVRSCSPYKSLYANSLKYACRLSRPSTLMVGKEELHLVFLIQFINVDSRKFHSVPSKEASSSGIPHVGIPLLLASPCISPGATYLHELTKNWRLIRVWFARLQFFPANVCGFLAWWCAYLVLTHHTPYSSRYSCRFCSGLSHTGW